MRFHWSDVRGADHCRTSQCFQRGESSGYPGIGRRLSPAPSGQALGPHSPASQSTVLSQLCPQPAFTLTQSSQLIPVDLLPLSSSPHALCPPSAAECSSVQEHDGNLPTGHPACLPRRGLRLGVLGRGRGLGPLGPSAETWMT